MEPVYSLTLTPTAIKDLKAIPQPFLEKIDAKILSLALTPRPSGCVKLAGKMGLFRVRCGDYRVLYTVEDKQKMVVVARVLHRREAYRGLPKDA